MGGGNDGSANTADPTPKILRRYLVGIQMVDIFFPLVVIEHTNNVLKIVEGLIEGDVLPPQLVQ